MIEPSQFYEMPLSDWVGTFITDWLVPNFRPFFQAIQYPVHQLLVTLQAFLQSTPWLWFTIVVTAIAWRAAGWRVALFTVLSLIFLDLIGIWSPTMATLAMIITAVVFCVLIGIPLGIAAAGSDRVAAGIRPILDIMQTIPPFVYLVPIVMLFGVGVVPGVIATIVFALPPVVRFTNLGIRQVQEALVEAAYAFGSSPRQVLWYVQIPLALRTIMAGMNQTLMLSLSMVVIAALIGAGGLGLTVYVGLQSLDVGRAVEGGIGIVIMAIVLDRITQALGENKPGEQVTLWQTLKSFFARRDASTDSQSAHK